MKAACAHYLTSFWPCGKKMGPAAAAGFQNAFIFRREFVYVYGAREELPEMQDRNFLLFWRLS